jgi:hypothetical protein
MAPGKHASQSRASRESLEREPGFLASPRHLSRSDRDRLSAPQSGPETDESIKQCDAQQGEHDGQGRRRVEAARNNDRGTLSKEISIASSAEAISACLMSGRLTSHAMRIGPAPRVRAASS